MYRTNSRFTGAVTAYLHCLFSDFISITAVASVRLSRVIPASSPFETLGVPHGHAADLTTPQVTAGLREPMLAAHFLNQ